MDNELQRKFEQVKEDARHLALDIGQFAVEAKQQGGEYMGEKSVVIRERAHEAAEATRKASREVDRLVHERAWTAITISALVGAVLSYLFSSRRKDY